MLERPLHDPRRERVHPLELEQLLDAEDRVAAYDRPLLLVERPGLVENGERDAGLADVVEQRRHAQIDETVLDDADALADGDRKDADVDRVVVGVLVVAAQVGEAEQVGLRREELVDHRLHDPLGALEPQRLAQLHVLHDVGDHFHGLRVDPLGARFRVLVRPGAGAAAYSPGRSTSMPASPAAAIRASSAPQGPRRRGVRLAQQREPGLELPGARLRGEVHAADPAALERPQRREKGVEAGGVRLEPELADVQVVVVQGQQRLFAAALELPDHFGQLRQRLRERGVPGGIGAGGLVQHEEGAQKAPAEDDQPLVDALSHRPTPLRTRPRPGRPAPDPGRWSAAPSRQAPAPRPASVPRPSAGPRPPRGCRCA